MSRVGTQLKASIAVAWKGICGVHTRNAVGEDGNDEGVGEGEGIGDLLNLVYLPAYIHAPRSWSHKTETALCLTNGLRKYSI